MLCRKIIDSKSNALNFNIHDIRRSFETSYRNKMAVKYHFPSQAIARSKMNVLRNNIGMTIFFRKPTVIKLNEDESFEAISVRFYDENISYIVTPDGKMHNVNENRVYSTTNMRW
jgi:hypothetical protein